jgi:hypothetical protein
MFASTLLTGLREEEDVEEVVKLKAERARRLSGLLDTEWSYVWRGRAVVRIGRDLVECCVSILTCLSAAGCLGGMGDRLSDEARKDELRYVGWRFGEQIGQSVSWL